MKLALKLTSEQIIEFIEYIKSVKPYDNNDKDRFVLDDHRALEDDGKGTSTMLKHLLDEYFKLYPEEDVYGYLDGSFLHSH